MAVYWISYSSDEDKKRRRRQGTRRQWRWPWQWFQRDRSRAQAITANDRPSRRNGEPRRIWPWLLLLLLLLLILPTGVFFLLDDSDETVDTDPVASAGELDPSSGPGGGPGLLSSPAPIGVPDIGRGALSIPDVPSLNLSGDTTFMDLGEGACQEERYVLMSNGRAHTIEQLDDETVEALARSEVPIDTVALDADADTEALQTIAERTGGAFTRMEP